MSTHSPARLVGALALTAALFTVSGAGGQAMALDPYDPWNAMYRPFVFPTAPPNGALPNQGRLDVIGGAATYGRYLDSLGAAGAGDPFGRTGSPGSRYTPYYQNYRRYGQSDRSYQPNQGDTFYQDQEKRQQSITDARLIRDPRRRAAEIKRLQSEAARAARRGDAVRGGTPSTLPHTAQPAAPAAANEAATSEAPRGILDDNPVARDLILPELRDTSRPSRVVQRRRPGVSTARPSGELPRAGR